MKLEYVIIILAIIYFAVLLYIRFRVARIVSEKNEAINKKLQSLDTKIDEYAEHVITMCNLYERMFDSQVDINKSFLDVSQQTSESFNNNYTALERMADQMKRLCDAYKGYADLVEDRYDDIYDQIQNIRKSSVYLNNKPYGYSVVPVDEGGDEK